MPANAANFATAALAKTGGLTRGLSPGLSDAFFGDDRDPVYLSEDICADADICIKSPGMIVAKIFMETSY
jgi:hypothetical protein